MLKEALRAQALALGFCDMGIAPAAGRPEWRHDLAAFVAQGRHGDMGWLGRDPDRRADPQAFWPQARSAIMLAVPYAAADPRPAPADGATISAYAQARDYHDTIRPRLKALGAWLTQTHGAAVKIFVDTSPVMEKPLAQQAGLGWQGRHTNLVSRRHGVWLFLAGMLTDLDLPPDAPEADRCGSCRACVEACPTGALDGSGRIEPRLCLAYQTIEAKSAMPEALRPQMGNRVFGCDACLAACPWGKGKETPPAERPDLAAVALADLAALDETGFHHLFAGTPVSRTGRDRFVAQVLIALANHGDGAARRAIGSLSSDPSPQIRAMAAWAASFVGGKRPSKL